MAFSVQFATTGIGQGGNVADGTALTSVAFWVKGTPSGGSAPIFLKTTPAFTFGGDGLSIGANGTGFLSAYVIAGAAETHKLATTRPILDGSWHQVTVTYDNGGDTLNVYVDGIIPTTSDMSGGTFNPNGVQWSIGNQALSGAVFNITDAYIYTRILSQAEAITLSGGGSISATNQVAWWQFTEGSGSSVADSSPSMDNMGLSDNFMWSSDVPTFGVSAKVKASMFLAF